MEEVVVMGVRLQRASYISPNPEFNPYGSTTFSVYDGLGYQLVSAETQALLEGNFHELDDHNAEMVQPVLDTNSWRWSDPEALRYDYQDAIRKRDTAAAIGTTVASPDIFAHVVLWMTTHNPPVLTNEVAREAAQFVANSKGVMVATVLLTVGAGYEYERWDDRREALEDRMEHLGILPSGT